MKTFKINNEYEIVCEWKKTRTAFKHEATLLRNGNQVDKTKICYLNRTWERYEFESVLSKMLEKSGVVSDKERKHLLDAWSKDSDSGLGAIAMVAALGDLFGSSKKQSNDWKKRMLSAGLGDAISLPNNWDELSEDEKEKRLNGAIKQLT